MSYNKTLNILIFDSNPNGLIMGEVSNWNGRVYKMTRDALADFSRRVDAQNTGVYFLFGRDDEMNDTIYIGEAEQMLTRLKQHINDHEEWNECIAVISKDNHLNKAHVKHLEFDFYQLVLQANRFRVTNVVVPTRSSVSEYDEAMLEEFIGHTLLLVNTLGYKAFEKIGITVTTPQMPPQTSECEFFIKSARGADARGISVSGGFTVLKGSKAASSVTLSIPPALQNMRDKLMRDNVIDDNYTFTRDYMFSSPSTAAAIVRGSSANGRVEWKNQQGKTLAEIENSIIGQ